MNKALLDTNILSYFLRGQANVVGKLNEYGQFYNLLTFSVLTYYEIKAGLTYRDSKRLLAQFEEIARESEILLLTLATMDIASNLYTDLRRRGLLIAPNGLTDCSQCDRAWLYPDYSQRPTLPEHSGLTL